LLVRALSSAEVDASFVDNQLVIELFRQLRPSFRLPSGREIRMQMDEMNNNGQVELSNLGEQETINANQFESSPDLQIYAQQIDIYGSYHHEILDSNLIYGYDDDIDPGPYTIDTNYSNLF
jgi:hypothetical protein